MPYGLPHPECEKDEVFVSSTGNRDISFMKWESKRIGDVAYDFNNEVIDGYYPIFVKRKELEEAGFDSDRIFEGIFSKS